MKYFHNSTLMNTAMLTLHELIIQRRKRIPRTTHPAYTLFNKYQNEIYNNKQIN
jgi:hypothetical protein